MSAVPAPLRRRLAVLAGIVILSVASVGPASAAGPEAFDPRDLGEAWDDGPAPATDQVIITFEPGMTDAERDAVADAAGLTMVSDLPTIGAAAYQVSDIAAGADIAALADDPAAGIASVTPDLRLQRADDPTGEPGWPYLWGLHNTGQAVESSFGPPDVDIDGLEGQAITGGDATVVVAVIDDGVDFTHPDLAARAWTNPGESGAGRETNGLDDDDNGYVDDVNGWDFCHDDNTVHDFGLDRHGTHVAGTIAASLDGQGVVGVAPNVTLMALKFFDDEGTCGFTSMAIEAIAYAKSFGVVISNNSWGGRGYLADYLPLYAAIASSGMLFVTSAGNEGIDNDTDPSPVYPASFDLPNVVSVAAAGRDGGLAGFSNRGRTSVDIAAPGVDIVSTMPADSLNEDGWWGYSDGTSMASPHVAGVAALLASQDPTLRVSTGVTTLRARLLATGKPLPLTVGETASGRMVDAQRALDDVAPVAVAPNSFAFASGAGLGQTTASTTVTWPAGTDDLAGIGSYDLQQRVNGGAWTTVVSSTAARTATRTLSVGATYQFRVRARDRAGNVSEYAEGPSIAPKLYAEGTSLATYTGTWSTATNPYASGGKTRFATKANASVSFRFNGRAVAIVAPKGTTRGSAKVYVDGTYAGTINLYRSSTTNRIVVFGRSWWSFGAHTIKLVVVGTAGHPRVDVDAFAVLR